MNSVSRYSRVMTRGDRVICVSDVVRDYILKNYSVDESRVSVIQRGVDMDLFNPDSTDQEFMQDFRQRFGLENRFVVTSVGRITWLKDYESFIRAIARCRESIPDIAGVIVGGVREDKRSYLKGLQRLASESGVADCVIFTGGQTRMPEIYQLSDVVVNASLKMGNVGRTVTEALAMNTPVIATTFEGLKNLVEDGKNGYIVANQDPDSLAECILRLYRAPLTGTRATIPAEFTLDAMVAETLAVYHSLTDRHADAKAGV
jgi:glycosyltransferase involved in cell wall biosynthesis